MATWGDIYRRHVNKGEDHGYAAFAADEWERRQERNRKRDAVIQECIDAIYIERAKLSLTSNASALSGMDRCADLLRGIKSKI